MPNTPAVLRLLQAAVRADRTPVADGLERGGATPESADDEITGCDRSDPAVPALDAAVGLEHPADHEVARAPGAPWEGLDREPPFVQPRDARDAGEGVAIHRLDRRLDCSVGRHGELDGGQEQEGEQGRPLRKP